MRRKRPSDPKTKRWLTARQKNSDVKQQKKKQMMMNRLCSRKCTTVTTEANNNRIETMEMTITPSWPVETGITDHTGN